MRAARAGLVLRGQRFASEQILRGPALAALSGPVKGQCRLVCREAVPRSLADDRIVSGYPHFNGDHKGKLV